MIRNEIVRIDAPNLEAMNRTILEVFGKGSLRIVLRKTTVKLKPHYKPLVRLAKAVYGSGAARRSGALAAAWGMKTWSNKRGTPRAAVIVGVNNKSAVSLNRFRSWQQKARNRYEQELGNRQVHPTPKRLTDPNYHKPSKVLHLVDQPVRRHQIRPRFRQALAAPEKGAGALWSAPQMAGGTAGLGVVRKLREKGARIAKRRHPEAFNLSIKEEADKKIRAALKRRSRLTGRGTAI